GARTQSVSCDEDANEENNKAGEPARLAAEQGQQQKPSEEDEAHSRSPSGTECSSATAPRRAQRRRVRHRSAGDLEPALFDLEDEIAGEAGFDAECALDPLPGLGDDILVEPLACRFVQRPDQKDRAL